MRRIQGMEGIAPLIREFAAAHYFRSASVDELELHADYYRRPLRPEDLSAIDFGVPVLAETICDLPSLAAQRILRCIYDMQLAGLPIGADGPAFERRGQFHGHRQRLLAAQIRPFLEDFAFGCFESPHAAEVEPSRSSLYKYFESVAREARTFWHALLADFVRGVLSRADLRFVFIQKWCLGRAGQVALAQARACGYFDPLLEDGSPHLGLDLEKGLLTPLASAIDANRAPHAFWQFYLPTALAETNYLSALAGRPERSLALIGASYVAELEAHSFAWTAREAGRVLGIAEPTDQLEIDLEQKTAVSMLRFSRALRAVEAAFGTLGLRELASGLQAAARLAYLARRDLETQLRWLANVQEYEELARRLDTRIRTERPNIDRETFVEPREMCSTTHVHDDHRLVVIESGNMVFWGRPEMRLRMAPGDMVLIPRGRLHGSSVESSECVYHQPIIMDEWVAPLVDEVDRRRGWLEDSVARGEGAHERQP